LRFFAMPSRLSREVFSVFFGKALSRFRTERIWKGEPATD
jgi:hypothetical protein